MLLVPHTAHVQDHSLYKGAACFSVSGQADGPLSKMTMAWPGLALSPVWKADTAPTKDLRLEEKERILAVFHRHH